VEPHAQSTEWKASLTPTARSRPTSSPW
jgi:hypothetical protein